MQSTTRDNHRIQDHQLNDYPALAALGITPSDLVELASQGFVCEEWRGKRSYYKLRFRRGGKQVVRYIGRAERAAIVEKELTVIQAESKIVRKLMARVRLANKVLRDAKRTIEPVIQANGFVFHGLAIRRPRQQLNEQSNVRNP